MPEHAQTSQDVDHLRLLSIFHYVVAGFIALISLFPIVHLVLGILMLTGSLDPAGPGNPPPAFLGWIFVVFAAGFILCGLTIALGVALAGRRLARHQAHTYCLVVAGIECLCFPFGTVLGVFTIIVLMRPSVKELFGATQ